MSTELLRVIIDGLNAPPFDRGLTLVKLDSMSNEKLLQTLSDVLSWIEGLIPISGFIDIRSESADETAMRILAILRILKYPPPRDIDEIQRWRLDLLEGNKRAIYPILKWIFENVDQLKERIYIGRHLTRVEIPLEEQTPEVQRLMQEVDLKIEEFKILHSQNVEARGDFLRALDVRFNDLKAMNEEREQLQRKIERCKRRTSRHSDMENLLKACERLRLEMERTQELKIQKMDQERALNQTEQRMTRLSRALTEEEHRKEEADPITIIQKLRREIEVNKYLIDEKLEHDLNALKANLEVVQRILAQPNFTKADIDKLKERIDQLNSECMELALQRDRKDEASEDKLAIYRHQSANVQRKKANVADLLQMTKEELENTEKLLAEKKRELSEKSGQEEVVTSVQYKLLLNKLRNKSNIYKRKKAESEQLKAEQQILERTLELLEEQFEHIKDNNRAEGRGVIEKLDEDTIQNVNQRPKTAKPTSVDVERLKEMIKQINEQIEEQRNIVDKLNSEIDKFYAENKEKNEKFYILKSELDKLQQEFKRETESNEIETSLLEQKIEEMRNELEKTNNDVQKQKWLTENSGNSEQLKHACHTLEQQKEECTQQTSILTRELNSLNNRIDLVEQTQMWQNLVKIFEIKLKCQQQVLSRDESKPWGDKR
ncbi:t-SNARE coiled-coil homology domain-containing protein [Meloidogyne graminicola]|uniref:t-SNARE coiled-coil homology domain-containing protein n=1 Tax=Meloidogyne graminicola TaxID=189291 RepID=A0A8T0A3V6_9BILA|nr:t-SNARE coiled-coil homology domain-containing protein [Meloidogyne graminicola]